MVPVRGGSRVTPPMMMKAWNAISTGEPHRQQRWNKVPRLGGATGVRLVASSRKAHRMAVVPRQAELRR